MTEYYVFQTQAEAQNCINYINSTPWFPIVGNVNGVPAPDHQKTTSWVDRPDELISGEWAVQRIPEERLDLIGVPAVARAQFLAAFGQDVRALSENDIKQPIEE